MWNWRNSHSLWDDTLLLKNRFLCYSKIRTTSNVLSQPFWSVQFSGVKDTHMLLCHHHHGLQNWFATAWMDPEDVILREISQTQKDKCYAISITCGVPKPQKTQNQTKPQSQMHRKRDQTYGYQRQRGLGGGNWRKEVQRSALPVIRWVSTGYVLYGMVTTANIAVWDIGSC